MVARGRVRFDIDYMAAHRIAMDLTERHVHQTAQAIERYARATAPRRTGALASSIRAKTRRYVAKVVSRIGSDLSWARVAHDGAVPHIIRPRRAGGRLTFYWAKVGHYVRMTEVHHPGMKGVSYLTIPLAVLAGRKGYRVTIF